MLLETLSKIFLLHFSLKNHREKKMKSKLRFKHLHTTESYTNPSKDRQDAHLESKEGGKPPQISHASLKKKNQSEHLLFFWF